MGLDFILVLIFKIQFFSLVCLICLGFFFGVNLFFLWLCFVLTNTWIFLSTFNVVDQPNIEKWFHKLMKLLSKVHIFHLTAWYFWVEALPETASLSLWASGKFCVHFNLRRPHLWDFTLYVVGTFSTLQMLMMIAYLAFLNKKARGKAITSTSSKL